jgi:succinate-semialdehyde dehydrogenase / glutarate-semialdehyde dehydrogenase
MGSAGNTDSSGNLIPIRNSKLFDTRGLVGGSLKSAVNNKTFPVYEPSSGQVLGYCSDFGQQDFIDAIDTAEAGFREFSVSTTAKERGALLRRWNDLTLENVDDCKDYPYMQPAFANLIAVATILSLENGKTFAEARGEVTMAATYVSWFAEEATRSNRE